MVALFVAVTDRDWFRHLSVRQPEEVNFWAPSGRTDFRALQPGELFLFKLHAPDNFIVGGGIFASASRLPLSIAWEAFGENNGVTSLVEMRHRIERYRNDTDPKIDPTIGCRILTSPFFWPRELWLPVPESFARNIVVGRGYTTEENEGARLWREVVDRSSLLTEAGATNPMDRYGSPITIRPRLGQGAFRVVVTEAYERRCVVSGERTLPILDAAHIRAYADGGDHESSNGLLLRTDIHKLFDLGYVTVDKDHRFVVSRRLKEDFDNGRHYYDLHGTEIRSPVAASAKPSEDALQWHRNEKFLG